MIGLDAPDRDAALGVDYGSCYRALNLPFGASLEDIEDRAQLLRAASQADALPEPARQLARERVGIVDFAAAQLRAYWLAHGTAPAPTDRTGDTAGLLDALRQALGGAPAAAPSADAEPAPVVPAVNRGTERKRRRA